MRTGNNRGNAGKTKMKPPFDYAGMNGGYPPQSSGGGNYNSQFYHEGRQNYKNQNYNHYQHQERGNSDMYDSSGDQDYYG